MNPTDGETPKPEAGAEQPEPKKGMSPEVRKAFEASWKRNEEAMRRLAKL